MDSNKSQPSVPFLGIETESTLHANRLVRSFLKALGDYQLDMPLTKFLPVYFKKNKQMGSTDRKNTSRLLYNYFRLGKACQQLNIEERVCIAEFLCTVTDSKLLEQVKPEFANHLSLPLGDKITWLNTQGIDVNLQDVFPFTEHLSSSVDQHSFLTSFFIQPDLFIRAYPAKVNLVKAILDSEQINYKQEDSFTFRLPNGTKLDQWFINEKPFEIQDLSSQITGAFFEPNKYDYWWDACAASGGKSILLHHLEPTVKLLVSDIRESVLSNLEERFTKAGIRSYQKKELDLMQNIEPELHHYVFDGIILDAPCTGSGTWGRTPEMLAQFEDHRIGFFQNLQKSISSNVINYLKPGKPLIYITCSVFKEENEQVVEFLIREKGLKLEKSELIKGYDLKADSMFVARLIKEE